MSLLFRINDKKKLVLDKACLQLCPKLKLLSEQQLLYTILVYDYYSKYHQFPIQDRKDRAIFEIYGASVKNPEDSKILKDGIIEYRSLQYDSRLETISTYNNKIAKLNSMVDAEDDPGRLEKLLKSTQILEKRIKDIQTEIDTDVQVAELHGGGRLSLIESLQENMDKFKREVKQITINTKE
jgi:hypothetical protein